MQWENNMAYPLPRHSQHAAEDCKQKYCHCFYCSLFPACFPQIRMREHQFPTFPNVGKTRQTSTSFTLFGKPERKTKKNRPLHFFYIYFYTN